MVEVAGPAALVIAAYFVVPLTGRPAPLVAGATLVSLTGLLLPLAVRRSNAIVAAEHPFSMAVRTIGLLATYVVVGFAVVHFVLADRMPEQYTGLETKLDALYFSVVAVTTVGFGDIAAVGQWARGVMLLHLVIGISLLGLAVRLTERAFRTSRGDPPDRS